MMIFQNIIRLITNGIAISCALLPKFHYFRRNYSEAENMSRDWQMVSNDLNTAMKNFRDSHHDAKKKKQ